MILCIHQGFQRKLAKQCAILQAMSIPTFLQGPTYSDTILVPRNLQLP